ncbi:MAG: PH domain-containing protein [Chloroflexota bacterium]
MLIHEELPQYDSWVRLLYLIPFGLFIAAMFLAYSNEYEGFLVLIGEGALVGLIFYFIMPRKYQIYQNKLRIVLGTPFGVDIPLATIKEVKRASGFKAYVYSGVRFATSSRNIVEIVRSRGLNYVISPQNVDFFIERFNEAVKSRPHERR